MRDIFLLGRGDIPASHMYGLKYERPPALVKRRWTTGVRGRLDYKGRIVDELDEEDVREAARHTRPAGAVPVHEGRLSRRDDTSSNGRAPRIGAGRAAAVAIVDFARGWTDRDSPLALPCAAEVAAAARLVACARARCAPVVFTTVAYDPPDLETVLMLRKTPRVMRMVRGSPLTEVDPRLAPLPDELVLVKKHASAFFGTTLASYLVARGVDTLLIGGCLASGCVRATAVDAAQFGFRALVVAEAVADRSADAREAALRSVDDLYGDVVSLDDAERVLEAAWG